MKNKPLHDALQKLDGCGGGCYGFLSDCEADALRRFMRLIVASIREHDRKGKRHPKVYRFDGGSVQVRTTAAGAVHIYSKKTGRPLAATFPGKLW